MRLTRCRRMWAANIAEPAPPVTHRLMADVYAAFEQQVFDIPQRQRETDVHHHHEADHLG